MEDSSVSSCYGIDNNTTMIGIEQFKQIAREILGNAFKSSSSSSPLPLKSLMDKIEEDLVIRIALQDLLSSQQLPQTEKDVKDQVCNQAYKFVNQHLLLMIEKLQKDGVASISTVDQEEFLNQYITFMFRVEPSDINYKMNFNEKPSQRKILQKVTPTEVLDKTTLAIEKAMRDINPERIKQMLDKKRDTDASETFEESMRTFEMLNQEESSALRKLAFALGYLKINEPNDEKYIQKVNNIFKNLGLQVELALPQEILSKPPQGGGSKKSSKSHSKSKSKSKSISIKQTWGAWKASGGVSDPAQQIIDRILNAKLQALFDEKIKQLEPTWTGTVSQKTDALLKQTVRDNIDKASTVIQAIENFTFKQDGTSETKTGKDAIEAYLAYIQTKGEEVNNLAEAKKATIAAVQVPEVPDVTAKIVNLTENIQIIDKINGILHPKSSSEGGSLPQGPLQQVEALTALKDDISVALNAIKTALEDGTAEAQKGLKSRVQDLTAKLSELEARLQIANDILEKGEEGSKTGIEPDIQNIQQRIAEISAKIGNAKISSADGSKPLTEQLLELKGILDGKAADIDNQINEKIEGLIRNKTEQLAEFDGQIVALQKQITNSDAATPGLTEKLNKLQEESTGLAGTIPEITKLLDSIKYTTQEGAEKSKVEAVKALQEDFDALKAKMDTVQASASAAETAAGEATAKARAADATAGAAQDTAVQTRDKANAIKGTVASKISEIDGVMRSIDSELSVAKNALTDKKDEILGELEAVGEESKTTISAKTEKIIAETTIDTVVNSLVKDTNFAQKLQNMFTGQTPGERAGGDASIPKNLPALSDTVYETYYKRLFNNLTDEQIQQYVAQLASNTTLPFLTELRTLFQDKIRWMKDDTEIQAIIGTINSFVTMLTVFHEDLKKETITLENLYPNIYTLMKDDLQKNLETVKTLYGEKDTKYEKLVKDIQEYTAKGTIKPGAQKKSWEDILGKSAVDVLQTDIRNYFMIKDSLYPVRIIVNYKTVNGRKLEDNVSEDTTYTGVGETNFIAQQKDIDENIQNMMTKNILTSETLGPYYRVVNSTTISDPTNGYNVEADIKTIFATTDESDSINQKIPHLIYSAYGFSGSGKTYTLVPQTDKDTQSLKNPNNILTRIANTIDAEAKKAVIPTSAGDTPPSASPLFTYKYRIYDYYGEKDDGGCIQVGGTDTKGIPTKLASYRKVKSTYHKGDENTFVELPNLNTIAKDISDFEARRKQDMGIEKQKTTEERHIRMTPNNPDSSRSHLIIDLQILQNKKPFAYVSIMDMAGSEKVDAIQSMYFEKIDTYDLTKYDENNGTIEKTQNGTIIREDAWQKLLTTQPNVDLEKDAKFVKNYNIYTYTYAYLSLINISNQIAKIYKINEFFSVTGTTHNFETADIKKAMDGKMPQNALDITLLMKIVFVNIFKRVNYNTFFTELCKENTKSDNFDILSFKENLRYYCLRSNKHSTFLLNVQETLKNIQTFMWELEIKLGFDSSQTSNKDVYEDFKDIASILKTNYYDKIISPIVNNNFSRRVDIIDTLNTTEKSTAVKTIYPNLVLRLSSAYNKDTFFTPSQKSDPKIINLYRIQQQLRAIFEITNKPVKLGTRIMDAKEYNESLILFTKAFKDSSRLKESITNAINDFINSSKKIVSEVLPNALKQAIYTWNTNYIYKIHCPLRFQGNFINDTLEDLVQYVKQLQETKTPTKDRFPGYLLHSDQSDLNKINAKFVLFTNIRLDFTKEDPDQVSEPNKFIANTNLKNAYLNSLEFSKEVNPMTKKASTSTGSVIPKIEGGAGKEKGADPVPSAPPAPGAPGVVMDPVAAIANAKEKLGELSDIKRDLNASITTFENMQTKVARFKIFQTKVKEIEVGSEDKKNENEIIGAYNYMKEEGVVIKEEFKKTIDAQKKSLKTLQNKLSKIIQSEPQTPNILRLLGKLIEIMEEKSSSKGSRGVYNDISAFYTSFEDIFNEAFSEAKRKASAIQEQRKISAEAQARGYGNPFGYFQQQQDRDRKREKEPDTRQQADNKPVAVNPAEPKAPPAKPENPPAKPEEPAAAAPARVGGKSPQEGGVVGVGSSDKTISESEENTGKIPQMEEPDKLLSITKGLKQVLDEVVGELIKMYQRRTNPAMSVFSSDSMFSRILNDYLSNRNETNEAEMRDRFMNQLEANDLVPRKVLAITQMDKIVFIFVTLFLRILCVSIITSLIERGVVKNMQWAVTGYLILYTLILIGFVAIVNLDMYRMRIVFNYINFHANAGKLYMHLGLLYILGILIYIIMTRVNLPVRNVSPKVISDNEKLRLIMRFQILTGILWFVLALVIMISSE